MSNGPKTEKVTLTGPVEVSGVKQQKDDVVNVTAPQKAWLERRGLIPTSGKKTAASTEA